MSMTGAGCGIDVAAHSLPAPTNCMRAVPSGPLAGAAPGFHLGPQAEGRALLGARDTDPRIRGGVFLKGFKVSTVSFAPGQRRDIRETADTPAGCVIIYNYVTNCAARNAITSSQWPQSGSETDRSVTYFTVPPRAHASAGSPSGSAAKNPKSFSGLST